MSRIFKWVLDHPKTILVLFSALLALSLPLAQAVDVTTT